MAWRLNEVWLDGEVLWFREQPRRSFPAFALAEAAFAGSLSLPAATGLEASRRRRLEARAARRRRFATRTVPAIALVLGSSTMLPISMLRQNAADGQVRPLPEDPPSLTFRFDDLALRALEAPVPRRAVTSRQPTERNLARSTELGRVEWGSARSLGLHYAGSLSGGTQLPVEGPDWVTWNPNTDSVPNLPERLYGHERTIRAVISVIADYRTAHPDAPPVVVGDLSFPHGGRMDGHVSHQNGLDVDVYYPRLDRQPSAPTSAGQVDRALSQALLDRFLAAGAKVVFVGYATGLRGPSGVVVPYPNHEDHMHVRFPLPSG